MLNQNFTPPLTPPQKSSKFDEELFFNVKELEEATKIRNRKNEEKVINLYWSECLDSSEDELRRNEILKLKEMNDAQVLLSRNASSRRTKRESTWSQFQDAEPRTPKSIDSTPFDELDIDSLLLALEQATYTPQNYSNHRTPEKIRRSSSNSTTTPPPRPPRRRPIISTCSTLKFPITATTTPTHSRFDFSTTSSDFYPTLHSPTPTPPASEPRVLLGKQLFTSPIRPSRPFNFTTPISPTLNRSPKLSSFDFPTPPSSIHSNRSRSSSTASSFNSLSPISTPVLKMKRQLSLSISDNPRNDFDLVDLNPVSVQEEKEAVEAVEEENDGWPPYAYVRRSSKLENLKQENLKVQQKVKVEPAKLRRKTKELPAIPFTSPPRRRTTTVEESIGRVHFRAEGARLGGEIYGFGSDEPMVEVVDWSELFKVR